MANRGAGHSVRIIGGNWRGRKVSFPRREGIRPTPDRVRETLFNWLQPYILDARCLELYAGSGILGIEALSRGAKHTTFVERDRATFARLEENLAAVCDDRDRYRCDNTTARHWLREHHGSFDIVFLDPPYDSSEWRNILPTLVESRFIDTGGLIYLETPSVVSGHQLPDVLTVHRQARAGNVHYTLCVCQR